MNTDNSTNKEENKFKLRALLKVRIIDNHNLFDGIEMFETTTLKEQIITEDYRNKIIHFFKKDLKINNILIEPITSIEVDKISEYLKDEKIFEYRIAEILKNIKKTGSFSSAEFKLRYACSFFLKDSKALVTCIVRDENTLEFRFLSNSIVSLYKGCEELICKFQDYNAINLRTLFTLHAILNFFKTFKFEFSLKDLISSRFYDSVISSTKPKKFFYKGVLFFSINFVFVTAILLCAKLWSWCHFKILNSSILKNYDFIRLKFGDFFNIGNHDEFHIVAFINFGIWAFIFWQTAHFITTIFRKSLSIIIRRNQIEFVDNKISIREPFKDDNTIEGLIIESPIKYALKESSVNAVVGIGAIAIFIILKLMGKISDFWANPALYITLITNWTPILVNYYKFSNNKKEKIIWKPKSS